MDKTEEITKLEKRIISEEEEIKQVERKINAKEEKILAQEGKILKSTNNLKLKLLHSGFIKRLNKHKILYSFITLISIILIWSGIQRFLSTVPVINNPLVSISLGVLIVWIIDKELT
ncbi:MAG: hypothetical protein AAB531_02330 [Patescibacteria group bacterium]